MASATPPAPHRPVTKSPLSPQLLKRFLQLSAALSPENLTADGERSPREVRARHRQLQSAWKNLEREAGRPVSEDEVWRATVGPPVAAPPTGQ